MSRNEKSVWLGDQVSLGGYVFDAYLRISHTRKLTVTQHPIETGATITDHSFVEPITFDLDIGMTDVTLGKIETQFNTKNASIKSRSIKAYDVLVEMQESRQTYTLICKYGSFNVLVEEITPNDDYTTAHALRASVRLREIIRVSPESTIVSADPYIIDSVNKGSQNSSPPEDQIKKTLARRFADWLIGA